MATDIVTLAKALGHDRFALAGHDRGALVAIRAGLDHPGAVSYLAILDVLPTLDMWSVLPGAGAAVAFHLYLMAQLPDLPEQMISASADAFFGHFLDAWAKDPGAIPDDVRAEYLQASRQAGSPPSWPTTVLLSGRVVAGEFLAGGGSVVQDCCLGAGAVDQAGVEQDARVGAYGAGGEPGGGG